MKGFLARLEGGRADSFHVKTPPRPTNVVSQKFLYSVIASTAKQSNKIAALPLVARNGLSGRIATGFALG